jgi:CheY-like chemotaxis protein
VPSQTTAVARVLIVHDNATVADSFSRSLRLEGYEVWAALSVNEGVTLAQVHCPNAIILVLRMPLAASLPFVRTIRALPGLGNIPVAIVTSDYHLDEPLGHELQLLGAQLHFTPLWLDELLRLARDLVA